LMQSHGVQLPAVEPNESAEGWTSLRVAVDGVCRGVIRLADTVAPHSRQAVEQLHDLGLRVVMLSGDRQATAERIAEQVGIDRIVAEVRPEQKQQTIDALRSQGHVVAMVGDGINDAPALAAADLGIAIGAGADVAIETAEVVLTRHDLRCVAGAVQLARATLRTIKQNLMWALLYNTLLIPVAAGVLILLGGPALPPAAAAAAMSLSSVSVVANSVLLGVRYRALS